MRPPPLLALTMLTALTALSCHHPPSRHAAMSTPPPPAAAPHVANVHDGVLITYQHGVEIGREHYHDDGRAITSDIVFNGRRVHLVLQRAPRHVRIEVDGHATEHDVPDATAVLENGNWQGLAVAAEWFASQSTAGPVSVFLPSSGATVPATLSVQPAADGAKRIEVQIGPTSVVATVSAAGVVTRAEVPSRQLEVLAEGVAPTPRATRPVPEGITEEAFELVRDGVAIRGTLWLPANTSGPVPVVLFVAGSGPTDRDGNQAPLLQSDTYRMLGEALARRGIASLRFDKRGVGQSGRNFVVADLTVQDLVGDVAALVQRLRADARFRSVTVAGHSEGGLLALMLPADVRVDGLLLLATAGRSFGALVREQLSRQLDAAGMADVDRIMQALRENRPFEPVPPYLRALFNPTVARYLRSQLDIDPVPLLRARHEPTTVIQGEFDAQVTVHDAELLAAARPGIRLVRVPHSNHLFKDETSALLPQASYTDPSRPLSTGVVDAMAEQILGAR